MEESLPLAEADSRRSANLRARRSRSTDERYAGWGRWRELRALVYARAFRSWRVCRDDSLQVRLIEDEFADDLCAAWRIRLDALLLACGVLSSCAVVDRLPPPSSEQAMYGEREYEERPGVLMRAFPGVWRDYGEQATLVATIDYAGLGHPAKAEFKEWRAGLELRAGPACEADDAASVPPPLTPPPLTPPEYGAWEGDWFSTDSSLEDNVYEMLVVTEADAAGFTYQFECRDVPYGPNAIFTDEASAQFLGPLGAEDPASGQTFALRIDADDRHARVIETNRRSYGQCALTRASPSSEFVFQRKTFRAGFDCDKAATPVEVAICHDELIALGDREMTELYRELLATVPSEEEATLRASQRGWLQRRNRSCLGGEGVVEECLARLYSDRLVELARVVDSGFGAGPRFDAAYVIALLNRDAELGQDTAVRLAMYPMAIGTDSSLSIAQAPTSKWQADDSGVVFESSHTKWRIVWPSDVEFRYSQMLFVGSDGAVWTARHVEPMLRIEDLEELNPHQVWIAAGGEAFTIRSDAGIMSNQPLPAGDVPDLVRSWVERHPVTETRR